MFFLYICGTANTQAVERGAESEAHLSQVSKERDELKEKLLVSERHHKKPDPRLDELQQELAHLKKNFQTQSDIQTRKASEAEQRATERAQCAERRAAGLEQRVSELSELLGVAERARHREQTAAQRLRDRVLQLDHENKMLAKAMTSDLGLENKMLAKAGTSDLANAVTSDLGVDESQLDVRVLKEKLENVKKILQLAAKVEPEHSTQNPQVLGVQDEVEDIQILQVQNLQKVQDLEVWFLHSSKKLRDHKLFCVFPFKYLIYLSFQQKEQTQSILYRKKGAVQGAGRPGEPGSDAAARRFHSDGDINMVM
ncbi:GRIP and coiled-coil domain-containing protein 1-like [Etheostoma cragini]|uniref:GRIP and coiled-coil domain-containing protein 1-like n=1 Tax=Etheostoma cragini TaxID=417921 RepID=UPI00155EF8AD|nr:GRIP and coiled-coil domain-containing protein 1-like [Etheostoma cragini]